MTHPICDTPHPLRKMVDEVLAELSPRFTKMYAKRGRPSRPTGCIWLFLFVSAGYSRGATVCEVLQHRLENNGKEIEIVGHLGGTSYSGFFVYEKKLGAPCEARWIFSWPSSLGLYFEGPDRAKLMAMLDSYGAKQVNVIVKGRLTTRSDYYIINLPWRPNRPLGKYSYGGVAAAIAVSEIKVKEAGE